MKIKKEDKKALSFLGGALIAGISIFYYNVQPIISFVGILFGAYLIIRALD